MYKLSRRSAVGIVIVTALASSLSVTAANAASVTPPDPTSQTVGGVVVKGAPPLASTEALDQLIATKPTIVVVDVGTGALSSVSVVTKGLKAQISHRTFCNAGDADWNRVPPLTNECFYGSAGTYTGSWGNVTQFNTGGYYARGGWISPTTGNQLWTPEQAPGSYTALTGSATGNKGEIF